MKVLRLATTTCPLDSAPASCRREPKILQTVVLPVPGLPKKMLCSDISCTLVVGKVSRNILLYRVIASSSSKRVLMLWQPTSLSSSFRGLRKGGSISTLMLRLLFCSIIPEGRSVGDSSSVSASSSSSSPLPISLSSDSSDFLSGASSINSLNSLANSSSLSERVCSGFSACSVMVCMALTFLFIVYE